MFQNNFYGPLEEGGCPFSHHDNEHLMTLMSHDGVHSNQNNILHLAADKQFSTACRHFYNEKVKVCIVHVIFTKLQSNMKF